MIERRNILIDYTFFFYFKHQQSYKTETINHIQILWEWMTKHDLNNAETTKFIPFSLCLEQGVSGRAPRGMVETAYW